ncbi:unnamed protein product [Prorocentrum cordatum]|uniref:Ribosome biogenesis protein NOP53 n=1 Tax=Prorocentrum cordatum TaxID=2364126 RepID=A0ABN9PMP8_9DINO|nr:unnamed protein product [Polarella glacialis]
MKAAHSTGAEAGTPSEQEREARENEAKLEEKMERAADNAVKKVFSGKQGKRCEEKSKAFSFLSFARRQLRRNESDPSSQGSAESAGSSSQGGGRLTLKTVGKLLERKRRRDKANRNEEAKARRLLEELQSKEFDDLPTSRGSSGSSGNSGSGSSLADPGLKKTLDDLKKTLDTFKIQWEGRGSAKAARGNDARGDSHGEDLEEPKAVPQALEELANTVAPEVDHSAFPKGNADLFLAELAKKVRATGENGLDAFLEKNNLAKSSSQSKFAKLQALLEYMQS